MAHLRVIRTNRAAGFTLLEVLLAIAIIGILAGIGIPVYQSVQVRNDLDIAATTVVQSIRRSQVLAAGVDGDANWGVRVQAGNITIFQGLSYATRNTNFDEVFDLPNSIVPSGISEIVSDKFTGMPQSTGTIILTSSLNENRTLTINAKGTVSY